MNDWICDKCQNKLDRENLNEIFAWSLYVCDDCIREFFRKKSFLEINQILISRVLLLISIILQGIFLFKVWR